MICYQEQQVAPYITEQIFCSFNHLHVFCGVVRHEQEVTGRRVCRMVLLFRVSILPPLRQTILQVGQSIGVWQEVHLYNVAALGRCRVVTQSQIHIGAD